MLARKTRIEAAEARLKAEEEAEAAEEKKWEKALKERSKNWEEVAQKREKVWEGNIDNREKRWKDLPDRARFAAEHTDWGWNGGDFKQSIFQEDGGDTKADDDAADAA